MAKGKRTKKLKTRNQILRAFYIFIGIFIVYTIGFYSYKGWQWDNLFQYVLGVGGITSVATAVLGLADKIVGIKSKKEDENNEVRDEQQGI